MTDVVQLLDECCEPGCRRQALRWFVTMLPVDGVVDVAPACLRHAPAWQSCEFCDHADGRHLGATRSEFWVIWPQILDLMSDVDADLSIPLGHTGSGTRITWRRPDS